MDDSDFFFLDVDSSNELVVSSTPHKSKTSNHTHSIMYEQDRIHINSMHSMNFDSFLKTFCDNILLLKLQQKSTNEIFSLCESLIRE